MNITLSIGFLKVPGESMSLVPVKFIQKPTGVNVWAKREIKSLFRTLLLPWPSNCLSVTPQRCWILGSDWSEGGKSSSILRSIHGIFSIVTVHPANAPHLNCWHGQVSWKCPRQSAVYVFAHLCKILCWNAPAGAGRARKHSGDALLEESNQPLGSNPEEVTLRLHGGKVRQ